MVEWLFFAVPWGCLRFVNVVFPVHTHLLFFIGNLKWKNHTSDPPLLMIVFQRNQSNTVRNGTADMYASGHPQHLGVIVLTAAQKGMR